jgi:hypothetical protein
MLEDNPELLNVSCDWSAGDHVKAVGGAGIVDNRNIDEYLIRNDALANLFRLATLRDLSVIPQTIELFPKLIYYAGLHGYTLLHHAEMGGSEANNDREYLLSLGLTRFKRKFQMVVSC